MVKRARIVLIVGDTQLRAYRVTGHTVTHVRERQIAPRNASGGFAVELREFAATIRAEWGRRSTTVLLAAQNTQVRTIDGLPQTRDGATLHKLIAASPFRFFLRRVSRPLVSCVVVREAGTVTVALADHDVVDTVVTELAAHGLVPDLIAVPLGSPDEVWNAVDDVQASSHVDTLLRDTLALPRPAWTRVIGARTPWWRPSTGAIAATVLLLLTAGLEPAWELVWLHRTRHASPASTALTARAVERGAQIDSVRHPLERLRSTAARTLHPLLLLDAVVSALPPEGHILTFDADTTHVQVTISAPTLTVFLRRLERNPAVSGVTIVGGISRDSSTAESGARALVRFRYHPALHASQR